MQPQLLARIRDIRGCLAHLRTPDEVAVRRDQPDEFSWRDELPGGPFGADADRYLASRAFRRLPGQMSVLSAVQMNSHFQTRLTHSIAQVAPAARTMAEILGLNANLAYASALAHDAKAPFGAPGERGLSKLAQEYMSGRTFKHERFGVVLYQDIERLNLTWQTLVCILNHSTGYGADNPTGVLPEADTLMYADKMYRFPDAKDMFERRIGGQPLFRWRDFPDLRELLDWFGATTAERIDRYIAEVCLESERAGRVFFGESEAAAKYREIKDIMRDRIYRTMHFSSAEALLKAVFREFMRLLPDVDPVVAVALLSDADALFLQRQIFANGRLRLDDIGQLALGELLPILSGRTFDLENPDLSWGPAAAK
ncbi:MAG: hypothetical protein PHT12_06005 [Patescibacteria group bacterium]|nr:hypothetical protein [Patescibacteria group bacterium]